MVVLDAWALLAYLKGEPPARRIEAVWLQEGATISSINLGEVLYIRMRDDDGSALETIDTVRRHLDVIDPDWPLVSAAAAVKAQGGLSYGDAFCVATALRVGAPLWTGDPEIVARAERHSCDVVDLRSQQA